MIELILGTYGVACWLVFKKFRWVPINTYTVCTAILGGIVLFLMIFILLSFYHPVTYDGRFYAPVTQIVPEVRGTVTDVPVTPNQPLKSGDVLFRIEPRPFQLEVERLEAALAQMNSQVSQLEARLASTEAATRAARSNLLVSESDYDRQARVALEQASHLVAQTKSNLAFAVTRLERQRELRTKNVITQDELDKALNDVDSLEAELAQNVAAEAGATEKLKSGSDRLNSAREALAGAEAQEREARVALAAESDGVNPEVRQTMAELERKRWDLEQCVVRAPTNGYVTHVFLRPGSMATPLPLSPLMVFVPEERPTLIATFPQNVIAGIKPGLEAEISFAAYPGRIFQAKVSRIMPIIAEGQAVASGQLRLATQEYAPGRIPVVLEYGDDVAALGLPVGCEATVAIYTEHVHALSIVRMIILRIKSWESYVFFLGH